MLDMLVAESQHARCMRYVRANRKPCLESLRTLWMLMAR